MNETIRMMNSYGIKIRNLLICLALMFVNSILSAQDDGIELKYLGTAGWIINDGDVTILVDPYISRIKLGRGPGISPEDDRRPYLRTDFYEPDTTLINEIVPKADFILVHHSHFDHLSDVPYIAQKTGAKVIGSYTTTRILEAYGIPSDQLYTIKGGEDYQFDSFSVKVVPSLHSALNKKLYFDGRELPQDLTAPLKIGDFIEGGSFMFYIRLKGKKILTMGSMNYIEKAIEGLKPDVLFAGVNFSRLEIYNYTERLLKATGIPGIIIPVHWDNFRVPYGFSQERAIEMKIKPFIEEVRAVTDESKIIIPEHLKVIKVQ